MARRTKGIPLHGWLNVDKPLGMTSTQVVGRVRRLLNAQKIGHAGTLDPAASGILPLALGEATKTIPYAQDSHKTYRFTVTWGEERNTDDAEGETTQTSPNRPTCGEIEAALPRFVGEIEQVPPQFSAIKIDGKRAYALARKGEEVAIKPRNVHIYSLNLLQSDQNTAEFEVHCGKGTYVRAIARDLGRILGCFGYVSALRRTACGVFSEKSAISLDKLEKMVLSSEPDSFLLPVETVLDDIPVLALRNEEVTKVRHGQDLVLVSRQDIERLHIAGADENTGTLLAIGEDAPLALLEKQGVKWHPIKLFNL